MRTLVGSFAALLLLSSAALAAEAEGQTQHEGVYQLEQELQAAVRRLAEPAAKRHRIRKG